MEAVVPSVGHVDEEKLDDEGTRPIAKEGVLAHLAHLVGRISGRVVLVDSVK